MQFAAGSLVFMDGLLIYNKFTGNGASKEVITYIPGLLATLSPVMYALATISTTSMRPSKRANEPAHQSSYVSAHMSTCTRAQGESGWI